MYQVYKQRLNMIIHIIGQRTVADMLAAASAIRNLRRDPLFPAELRGEFDQTVCIWRVMRRELERLAPCHIDLRIPYETTELVREGIPIPSRLAPRPTEQDPMPPPAVVKAWLDRVFATEDSLREFCCFRFQEYEPGTPPEPLIRFRGGPIPGARIASLYREKRIVRPWDDPDRDSDVALVQDFLLAIAVVERGRWTAHVAKTCAPRIRPYVRAIPDELLMPTVVNATGFLEGKGLLHTTGPRTWTATPAGRRVFEEHIRPAWLEAAQGPKVQQG